MDFENIQLYTNTSSQKVVKEGSGSFSVPSLSGSGTTSGSVSIPHNYGSNNLIIQVQASKDINGTDATVLPWASNDGRLTQYATVDSTNVNIYCVSKDISGAGSPARTVTYTYRLIAP